MTTRLRGIKKGTDEETEGDRGQAENKEVAEDNTEVSIVEQASSTDDSQDEGQQEPNNNTFRDEIAGPVSHVRETHHAHGLLQTAALLEHDLDYNALDVDPESKGHNELFQSTGGEEREDGVEEEHESKEEDGGEDNLEQVPLGLCRLQIPLPQQQSDLEEQG